MARKKTRFHSRWANDADFFSKLSPELRAWYEKFVGEYYRAEFQDEPLHPRGKLRASLYARQNYAARDVVTAAPGAVAEQLAHPVRRPSHAPRFYAPADYVDGPRSVESDLIEWLDFQRTTSSTALSERVDETEEMVVRRRRA